MAATQRNVQPSSCWSSTWAPEWGTKRACRIFEQGFHIPKTYWDFFTTSQLSPALEIEELLNMPAVVPRKIAVLMSEVRGRNGWRSQTGINLWLQPRATSANAQRLQPWRSPHCISFVISIYESSFLIVVPDKVASDDFRRQHGLRRRFYSPKRTRQEIILPYNFWNNTAFLNARTVNDSQWS